MKIYYIKYYKPKNQCLLCGNAGAATSAHQVCGTLLAEESYNLEFLLIFRDNHSIMINYDLWA